MAEDHRGEFARLQMCGDALATEFEAVKRGHEAGLISYEDALARHKALTAELYAVAARMRALVPGTSHLAPPDLN